MTYVSPKSRPMSSVLWVKTLEEEARARPAIAEGCEVDLTIVGGGLCGLNAALHSARAGLSVILLEQNTIGSGASGRNAGVVVPQFHGSLKPSDVVARLGGKKGSALSQLVMAGADTSFEQIRAFDIKCGARRGWIQAAHSAKSFQKLRGVYEEWRALGAKVDWLSKDETFLMTGAHGHCGGWSNPSGGALNPYSLCLGLARVAEAHGAKIYENSRVERYERDAKGTLIHVNHQTIRSTKVILAANAYADAADERTQRSAVPVCLFLAATKPLPPRAREQVLQGVPSFSDLRMSGGYAIIDTEGRLISGGASFGFNSRRHYGPTHVRQRLSQFFPHIGPIEIESYWEGFCAFTNSQLPHIQIKGNDFISIGGYCGRGVSLSQSLGRVLAEFVSGKRTLDDIPIDVYDRRKDVPMWGLKTHAARFAFPVFKTIDRLGFT